MCMIRSICINFSAQIWFGIDFAAKLEMELTIWFFEAATHSDCPILTFGWLGGSWMFE